MTDDELLGGFSNSVVRNATYGIGHIKQFYQGDLGNYYVTVLFCQDGSEFEKTFSANIAFPKKVLVFDDEESGRLINAFFEHKEAINAKSLQSSNTDNKKRITSNDLANLIIEQLLNNEIIATDLTDLFDDTIFEKELCETAFRFLETVMNGGTISQTGKVCLLVALTLIAQKYYNGDLHSFIENKYREYRPNTERRYSKTRIQNGVYKAIGEFRSTVKYFDPHSYIAVPIILSCVPHYRMNDLFRISYDIYKRKLLFDEDVTDEQIEETAKETFLALRKKGLISDSDTIKGTNYLMSKYTQSCIYSGFGIDALSKIVARCIRLIIDHLTRPEDSFSIAPFYQEGYLDWVNSFEEDVRERSSYEQTRTFSHPYFKLIGDSIHIFTGKHSMDDSLDPNDVHIVVYSGDSVITDYLITDPNSIVRPDDDSVMNGYIIERQDLVLSCSPIKEISYSVVCNDKVIYNSKSRLYRTNLFFDGKGNEIKPGSHYSGELFVITKDSNNDDNGNGLTELYHRSDYIISTIEVNDYDVFHFDGEPYVFFKVSTSQLTSYAVPWGDFISFEGKRLPIYNNIVILFPASCDKEQIYIEIDGKQFFYDDYESYSDIRFNVKLYSKEQNGAWTYTAKIYNLPAGFHRIRIFNAVTGKQIKGASFEIIYDYAMRKIFSSKNETGIQYKLSSSFFEEQILEYPYGTPIVELQTFINNIGPGKMEIYPSSVSYSIDEQHWFDIDKTVYLCDIPDSVKNISICGPQNMKAIYIDPSAVAKRQELNLVKNEKDSTLYMLSLSFLRSLVGKKNAEISFEFNNICRRMLAWYNPYVITRTEDFYFDKNDSKHIFKFKYESNSKIKVVITPIPLGPALVSKTISNGDSIEILDSEIGDGVRYLSIALFGKKNNSLFDQFQSEPFLVFKKYDLGRPNARLTTNPPVLEISDSVLSGTLEFEYASKIKAVIIPTSFNTPLYSKSISSGDSITLDLGLYPFNSYQVHLYNFIDEATEQIAEKAFFISKQIRTDSPFLKRIMPVSTFVFTDEKLARVNYTVRFNKIQEFEKNYYLVSSMVNQEDGIRADNLFIPVIGDSDSWYIAEMYRLTDDKLRRIMTRNGKVIHRILIEKN